MYNHAKRILVLGTSGMLGHTLCYLLPQYGFTVHGTVRGGQAPMKGGAAPFKLAVTPNVDALDMTTVRRVVESYSPDIIVNCIGTIRQRPEGRDKQTCTRINALFPHALLEVCRSAGCRLVHYSSDCVFDGRDGKAPYHETDTPSAHDAYGMSKFLGELDAPALTLRTSIIGHELHTSYGLVEWFLRESGTVRGFARVMYSGLTACEHARILAEYIVPRGDLQGLFHVAGEAISKHELLHCIAAAYQKDTEIIMDCTLIENKILYAGAFTRATGYTPPPWDVLVASMRSAHDSFLGAQS